MEIIQEDPMEFRFKSLDEKIEFRTIQLLVGEYQNLPILHKNFEKTTKDLYIKTTKLL